MAELPEEWILSYRVRHPEGALDGATITSFKSEAEAQAALDRDIQPMWRERGYALTYSSVIRKMTLQEARDHYRTKRSQYVIDSNLHLACTKILMCLDNTQDPEAAKQFLQEEIDNATGVNRRAMYQEALASLQ